MDEILYRSKSIWFKDELGEDEFGEFYIPFDYAGGNIKLYLFADSDYIVKINGKEIFCGQYHGYPDKHYYDVLDLTTELTQGKNAIVIIVWHYGGNFFTHIDVKQGLVFEIRKNDETVVVSDRNILSKKSETYMSGQKKYITCFLGYSFTYNANGEKNFYDADINGFKHSSELTRSGVFYPRPVEKLIEMPKVTAKLIRKENNRYLFDLGKEYVGYICFRIKSEGQENIQIAFGEHISDGWVRSVFNIGRDFSITYITANGMNEFVGRFRRIGCRYIEIKSASKIEEIGLIPVEYPIQYVEYDFGNDIVNKIYQTSLHTLKCCMHEHYEDCPWREQALYTMDSKNQMRSSYYAFKNIKEYVKSNLRLIAMGQREDGQLNICFPCSNATYIPSFTLHFIAQVKEYIEFYNDIEFAKEIIPVLTKIIKSFLRWMKNGLVQFIDDKNAWNFYEWKEGYDYCKEETSDLILNCLLSIALKDYDHIVHKIGYVNQFDGLINKLNEQIINNFYDEKLGIFLMYSKSKKENICSEYGNSLAILAELFNESDDRLKIIERELKNDHSKMTKIMLGVKNYKYDALLKLDFEGNKEYVLDTIRADYTYMLNKGATTFWETIKGEDDFEGNGSLCHGWSSIPIYYYHRLLLKGAT